MTAKKRSKPNDSENNNKSSNSNSNVKEQKKQQSQPQLQQQQSDDERAFGVTSTGQRFRMPALKDPFSLKTIFRQISPTQLLKYSSALNLLLLLVPSLPSWVFVALFFFWRSAYNFGLGYLLQQQSIHNSLTKAFIKFKASKSNAYFFWKRIIERDMGPAYRYDDMPDCFNAWLFFRVLVDFILANDLVCYFVMCCRLFELPDVIDGWIILKYVTGVVLSLFALWGKSDAYRVIGSFAWYWGDFFFLVDQNLTFDRVFGIAPHPMYTLGYSFFYGASLICGSYAVFAISLTAHVCQMLFLVLVENPHIEKTYNTDLKGELPTVAAARERGYIRSDLIVLKNFNPYRDSDLFMIVMCLSYLSIAVIPTQLNLNFFIGVAIICRFIHSIILPTLLYQQSKRNAWLDGARRNGLSVTEAFDSWKRIYNTSMVMCHLSLLVLFVKLFDFSSVLQNITNVTLGVVLVVLNLWCANEIYEVVGDFGWFYGDFFVSDVPSDLMYTGIYRYVNNPETVLGFAGYYGLALASMSWVMLAYAMTSHVLHVLFVRWVEEPHMKRRYGDMRRPRAGVESTVQTIVREAVESRPRVHRVVQQVSKRLEKLVRGPDMWWCLFVCFT